MIWLQDLGNSGSWDQNGKIGWFLSTRNVGLVWKVGGSQWRDGLERPLWLLRGGGVRRTERPEEQLRADSPGEGRVPRDSGG